MIPSSTGKEEREELEEYLSMRAEDERTKGRREEGFKVYRQWSERKISEKTDTRERDRYRDRKETR